MANARERLAAARMALDAGFRSTATSAAYYAMFYAARAALSEEERNARTHRGVWGLFGELFVVSGRFDEELLSAAQRGQDLREAGDYEARAISPEEGEAIVADADRFVSAVADLLGA
jgi:uncharacterized protein (UPF0332 family)